MIHRLNQKLLSRKFHSLNSVRESCKDSREARSRRGTLNVKRFEKKPPKKKKIQEKKKTSEEAECGDLRFESRDSEDEA